MRFILLLNFYILIVSAQQLPTHNEFQELGLSFDIPNGWQGRLSESSVILGHNSISGLMLLTENLSKNALELKIFAMDGITDEGIKLIPSDDFKTIGGNRVEGFYQGYFNGAEVKVYTISLINGLGRGINIIIMAETAKFTKQHQIEANKLAASIKFFKSVDLTNTNSKSRSNLINISYK